MADKAIFYLRDTIKITPCCNSDQWTLVNEFWCRCDKCDGYFEYGKLVEGKYAVR